MKKNPNPYIMSLENFKCFIEICKDNKKSTIINRDFKDILYGRIFTLEENDKFFKNRKLKVKFTKIIEHLQEKLK